MENPQLFGKIILQGTITALTGLHIGGAEKGLKIGGADLLVVRSPLRDNQPYIPGSSLKGKMRSLLEKSKGKEPNYTVQRGKPLRIHLCDDESKRPCELCKTFGMPGNLKTSEPTRLIVRDAFLAEDSTSELGKLSLDLPYTEVKSENVLDRITSAAMPRQIERVPAGTKFDFEAVYTIFDGDERNADIQNFKLVLEALQLVEDDYLGGQGTRGYGKVKFDVSILWKNAGSYEKGEAGEEVAPQGSVVQHLREFESVKSQLV